MLTYDHERLCPKCRFIQATTTYQKGYHGSPCGAPGVEWIETTQSLLSMGWGMSAYASPETRSKTEVAFEELQARQKAIPEHFDRTCPNCGHLWAEVPLRDNLSPV